MRSSHDRFGASAISRTTSSKYVGWLFGRNKDPFSGSYRLRLAKQRVRQPRAPHQDDMDVLCLGTGCAAASTERAPWPAPPGRRRCRPPSCASRRPSGPHPAADSRVADPAWATWQRPRRRSCAASWCQPSDQQGVLRLGAGLTATERDMVMSVARKDAFTANSLFSEPAASGLAFRRRRHRRISQSRPRRQHVKKSPSTVPLYSVYLVFRTLCLSRLTPCSANSTT